MERACDTCGATYEAQRKNSRFCSDRCRARNGKRKPPPPTPLKPAEGPAGLVEVTVRELGEADLLDTVLGQQALALAARIGRAGEPGNSVASLSKEFRAVMDEIRSAQPAKADPLDELGKRRESKRAAG